MNNLPSLQYVASRLRHEDGVLYWLKSAGGYVAGKKAGCADRYGYWRVTLNRSGFLAHRIVWLLTHGDWPTSDIDHINGEKTDNRPSNLRLCNDSQNQMNRRSRSFGSKGTTLHKQTGKFQAQIKFDGKSQYLGLFHTREDAAKAYDKASLKKFGEFARPNFRREA